MKHLEGTTSYTKADALSEEDIAREEGIARKVGAGALLVMAATVGYNYLIPENQEPAVEQPSPAAVAEQNAVDYVGAVHNDPSQLDPENTTIITIEEGDSINGAAKRAAEKMAKKEGWDAEQKNLNNGIINETADAVLAQASESLGYAVSVQPGDTVVMVKKDVNGGTGEFFPVGFGEELAQHSEK